VRGLLQLAGPTVLKSCALGLLGSCNGTFDVEAGEHCRQAGYSIAARTEACTRDRDRANALYERFTKTYLCLGSAKDAANYYCAADLNAATCDQVKLWGSDLEGWITDTTSCHAIIGGRGDPNANPDACGPLAESLASKMAACAPAGKDFVALTASVQLSLGQTGCGEPSAAALSACQAQLTAASCFDVPDYSAMSDWLVVATDCAALLRAAP
jgi:hypothetical protein